MPFTGREILNGLYESLGQTAGGPNVQALLLVQKQNRGKRPAITP